MNMPQIAPNQYLLIAHLQRASLFVKIGERVCAGQPRGALNVFDLPGRSASAN
jgi:hypothetical protein